MTTPNLPPAIRVHAAGSVDGAGALGPGSTNVSGVVRDGAGEYTVTLGTEIDPVNSMVKIQAKGAAFASPSVSTETDSTFKVHMFDAAGAAADSDFDFEVTRHSIG